MNVALGIGALLLSGWVLNTPVQDLPPEEADKIPDVQLPFPKDEATGPAVGQRNRDPRRQLPRDEVQGQIRNEKAGPSRTMNEGTKRAAIAKGMAAPPVNPQAAAQKQAAWALPQSPTDPLRANGPVGTSPQYPVPPTVQESALLPPRQPVDPYGSPNTPTQPYFPQSRQAVTPRSADSSTYYNDADQMRGQVARAMSSNAYSDQPVATKAFSDARPFSGGGASPYMNLFRNDTAGGTIDNYSTFVRPALDQRSMNMQFNMDMYGMQRNQRIQNAALQQLGRGYNQRAPQFIGTPAFYMNYGNYYPGAYGQSNYGPQNGGGY
jgi:hypothetical protein